MRVYYCLSTSACALLFGFNVAYGLDIKTSDKLLLNTHLIDTNQNQFFETLPRAGLDINLPKRFHFKTASVSFITGNSELVFPEFPDVSVDQCKNFGYTLTSCPNGNPSGICPYNTSYFKECCDVRYKYNKKDCTYPNTVSGDSCGGKFMCYCDRSLYPETKCISPMIAIGVYIPKQNVSHRWSPRAILVSKKVFLITVNVFAPHIMTRLVREKIYKVWAKAVPKMVLPNTPHANAKAAII